MKTKFLGKMTLLAFVLMVTLSFGLLSPMLLAGVSGLTSVEKTNAGYIIELTGYQSSYDIDDARNFTVNSGDSTTTTVKGYALPKATVKDWNGSLSDASGVDVTVSVKNSSGRTITPVTATDGTEFIQTGKSDTYYITYSAVKNDITTATRDITIDITAQDASFEFDSNSAQIMPTVVQAGDEIVFPMPKIALGDEEDSYVENPNIQISLEGPNNEGEVGDRTLTDKVIGDKTYKAYTVANTDAGTFTVTYQYTNNGTDIFQKYTFSVVSQRPEVTLAYSGWTNPTSIENLVLSVGQEATLPTPTVINTAQNNAAVENVYTQITIVNQTTNETFGPITDFKFTPTQDGDYRITYLTTDFTGQTYTFTIYKNNVKKTGDSITVKVVEDYSSLVTTDAETDDITIDESMSDIDKVANADYGVPSTVYLVGDEVTVNFPAIYATAGWGDYNNLKLTRQIYKRNSFQQTLENQRISSDSEETYKAYQTAPYKFTSEGEYSIRYIANYVDENGNDISGTTRQLSFSFTVKKVDAQPEIDLTLTTPNITKSARKGSTITFSAPTVSDVESTSNEVADANVKIDVTYNFTYNTDQTSDNYTATLNADNLYEIVLECPEGFEYWDSVSALNITFDATDDFNTEFTPITKTVSIVDFSSDNVAPTLTAFTDAVSDDNTVINLPTVTFEDSQTDISLVAYILKNNKVMDVINANTGRSATISGATYTPTEEGTYTVTFIATDQNNNISTISINYTADFNNGYSVTIDSISAQEYGTVIDLLDRIHVTDHGEAVDLATLNVVVVQDEITQGYLTSSVGNNTLVIQVMGDYTFPSNDRLDGEIVTLEGDITVRAWAKDANGVCDITQNGSSEITFSSSDSTNPTFTIEDESLNGKNYAYTDDTEQNRIELPWFDSVRDTGSGINFDSMKIELSYQDDSETEVFKTFTSENIDDLSFIPSRQGKINAVYSVADNMGNTYTRTFVLNVGDVTAPEIILEDDAVTCSDRVNGKLKIDLSKVSILNDSLDSDDLTITITRDGTNIDFTRDTENRNLIEIDLDTAGTYVVTFDVKDAAGNAATQVVKTFTVGSEPSNTVNTSTIWGTVLIIVSLIVLGLVIFFFVKPSKSKNTTTVKTNKKDSDKKDEKKNK